MSDDTRRVSLTELAEGFDPAEVDLFEAEEWGGLFLTVEITKPVQRKLNAIRKEAAAAATKALAVDADDPEAIADAGDDDAIDPVVDMVCALYGAMLVPAPGHKRKSADKVMRRAYDEGRISLERMKVGFQQITEASRPT